MSANGNAAARIMEKGARGRRLGRRVLALTAATALILLSSGCALDSPNAERDSAGSRISAGEGLLYFVASAPELSDTPGSSDALASARSLEADFQTLSGERFRFRHASSPRAVVPRSAIKGIELREDGPGLWVTRIALEHDLGDRFLEIRQNAPEHFLLVKSAGNRGLDYLPTVFAVRRDPGTGQVWVASGAFPDRGAAEAFFEDVIEVPRRTIALSEPARRERSAHDAKLIEYALWLSVCDAAAATQLGEELATAIAGLPDSAGRRSEMDCAQKPKLGAGAPTIEDIRR